MKPLIQSMPEIQRMPDDLAEDDAPEEKMPPFIRKIFSMLHGHYGSKFTGQFALGVLDKKGKIDLGVKSAQTIWLASLKGFDDTCVIDAVGRLLRDEKFHEWPPTLSRIIAGCESQKHQSLEAFKAYKPPVTKLIGASREALDAHGRKVRAEAAARMAAQAAARRGEIDPVAGEGVPALLALASRAIALAGGDEVAALRGMERRVMRGAK